MNIDVPSQAIVIAIGGRHAPMAEVLDLVPAHAQPWDVNRPADSEAAVSAALALHGRVRCATPRAHRKAVADIARIARRAGAASVLLRLPGSPDLAGGEALCDRTHDVAGPEGLSFTVTPMPCDLTALEGPFDIIGDVHGCADELLELLGLLGHLGPDGRPAPHPDGRIPALLGDYTDRGPKNALALETAMAVTRAGGLALLGNHDAKLARWLKGADVRVAAGLEITIGELSRKGADWRREAAAWLDGLPTHLLLDGDRLAIAHAGIDEANQGKMTPAARDFALFGKPASGARERTPEGHSQFEDWAPSYAGARHVVHGHIVHPRPRLLNNVASIDTGCVFGGSLTAYRWPERTFASVPARATYFAPREGQEVDP